MSELVLNEEVQLNMDLSAVCCPEEFGVKHRIVNRQGVMASILKVLGWWGTGGSFLVSNVPAKMVVREAEKLAKQKIPFNKDTVPSVFQDTFVVNVTIPCGHDSSAICYGVVVLIIGGKVAEYSFPMELRIKEIAPGVRGWVHANYAPVITVNR